MPNGFGLNGFGLFPFGLSGGGTPAPTVTSVAPGSLRVFGGAILIEGTGFDDSTTFTVNGEDVTDVVVVSSTAATGVAPALSAGTYNVSATNLHGTGTLVGGLVYIPPISIFQTWAKDGYTIRVIFAAVPQYSLATTLTNYTVSGVTVTGAKQVTDYTYDLTTTRMNSNEAHTLTATVY